MATQFNCQRNDETCKSPNCDCPREEMKVDKIIDYRTKEPKGNHNSKNNNNENN